MVQTAQRLAFSFLDMKEDDVVQFAKAFGRCKTSLPIVVEVDIVNEMTHYICEDKQSDRSVDVWSKIKMLDAMEKMREYKGLNMYCMDLSRWMALGLKILNISQL